MNFYKKTALFLCFSLCIFFSVNTAFSTQFSGDDYNVPIDYSKIDKTALADQANLMYTHFEQITEKEYRKKYILPLLNMYCILQNMAPGDPFYATRVGVLYDELGGHDDLAKSNLYKATNIDPNYGYSFYSFGNFYFSRGQLRRAIEKYKQAVNVDSNYLYDRNLKMGIIYEKLGDYRNSVFYYKEAYRLQNSKDLYNKILLLEDLNSKDMLYHKWVEKYSK